MNKSTGPSGSNKLGIGLQFRAFLGICLTIAVFVVTPATHADVLIGTNGDRFTGEVVKETADSVIFDSDLGGRLTILRSRIREIQRSPTPISESRSVFSNAGQPSPIITNSSPSDTNVTSQIATSEIRIQSSDHSWLPPAIGHDNADWLQLKSGEWIRGHLYYIQKRKVEFDSDVLNDFSIDLKDVRQVYPANPLFTKFNDRAQIFGMVVISNDVVEVFGPQHLSLPRDQLTGITRGGKREIDFWSGNLNIALSLQSGNTRQATLSTSTELARRAPASTIQLNYLGNYNVAEGVQTATNHRINGLYDIRLNRHWFVRPVYIEYYTDELANIAHKGTVGVGVGYYIFDREDFEWLVAGGPGYQRTYFETVEPGQSESTSTPAAVLQTSLKYDITRRLKFIEAINFTFTSKEAGLYSHHAVSTLNFEIKRHLDLNTSFVWDYLQNPQIEASGFIPEHSDFRLNVGVGMKF